MEPITSSERKSLKKTVIQEIKNYIIDNDLKAEDKLPTERKFTEMFGVSRSVVREALSYMENTDVIRVRQGQGAFLNESNIDTLLNSFFFLWQINGGSVRDIQSLRVIFECSAIDDIVRDHKQSDLDRLKKTVEDGKRAETEEEYKQADISFHKQLLHTTNNELFIQMTHMITTYFFDVIHIQLTPGEYQRVNNEHDHIVKAISNGQAEKAKRLLTEHIKNTRDY
ncbi:FadR/GntR family transcriptional regulator [Virgibacillus sp. CBA3643]|uniref:FadR/GntR family transcriptional regulator n=1 Tax=Virgibacillus sp. CBA3643 TaxID=2942278 RepID=UPI0035A3B054